MAKEIHLWWLWDTPSQVLTGEGKELLTVCGRIVPREEITVAVDCITCVHCRIKAQQAA